MYHSGCNRWFYDSAPHCNLNGQTTEPEDITVIGGKTGTTNAAGYCLVLYSKNKKGDDIVSIVYKGKTRSDMYTLMNQILSTFAN